MKTFACKDRNENDQIEGGEKINDIKTVHRYRNKVVIRVKVISN